MPIAPVRGFARAWLTTCSLFVLLAPPGAVPALADSQAPMPARFARFEAGGREPASPARALAPSAYDPLWTGYAVPSVRALSNGPRALVMYGGGLVASGSGKYWGTTVARNIALWDGVGWQPLGEGLASSARVLAAHSGMLIAGGRGGYLGGAPMPAIFAWDGVSWTVVGSLVGTVYDMVVVGSELYVGGDFTSIDGVAASKIARWDGASWHAVGGGFSGASEVRALVAHGDTLVAGGSLPDFQGVARWDGANWTQVGAGLQNGGSSGSVSALASDGVTLYAGGTFNASGGAPVTNVAAWDGAVWSGLAGATVASEAMATYGSQPMATVLDGGVQRAQLWDGAAWQPYNKPVLLPLAYTADGADLYATGWGYGGTGNIAPTAAIDPLFRFDGSAWSAVHQAWSPGMRGLAEYAVAALSWQGSLYVAGLPRFVGADDHYVYARALARWDGENWHAMGETNIAYSLVIWSDSLVAGFGDNAVRIWNGSTWRKLAPSQAGSTFTDGITGVATYQGGLYALGAQQAGATVLNGIGRWDGSNWLPVGSGFDPYWSAWVGTEWDSKLVVAGRFDTAGGTPARHIAWWDGAAYHDMGGGVNGDVECLLADGTDLLAGGLFTEAGGESVAAVARWDGAQWHAMGTRGREVHDLRAHGGRIYAAGDFVNDQGDTVATVAVWAGSEWTLLGSGCDPYAAVMTLDFMGDDLYMIGDFGMANGHPARSFAKLANVSTLDAPGDSPRAARLALAPSPNPARGAVRFSVTLPAAGRARLVIRDVAGREVARLLDGAREAGTFSLAWEGRVAPGLYFATLEATGERVTTRVVRLR